MTCGLIILQDISEENVNSKVLKETLECVLTFCDIAFLSSWNRGVEVEFPSYLPDKIYNTNDVVSSPQNTIEHIMEFDEIIFVKGDETRRFTKIN